MADPPARNFMFKAGFTNVDPTCCYDAQALFCGGKGHTCSVCGEDFNASPKLFEAGGKYATGTIGRTYEMGSEITVRIQITANHNGYFRFKVCPVTDNTQEVTQSCLDSNVLTIDGASTERLLLGSTSGEQTMRVKLPQDLSCERCVFQWHWYANFTGEDFINCADIKITSSGNSVITHASNNLVPITEASNNLVPITKASNNLVPMMEASNNLVPITEASNNLVPITEASNKLVPMMEASNNLVPITEASNNLVPMMKASNNLVPVMEAPNNLVPMMEASNNLVPVMEAPNNLVPVMEAPNNLVPITEASITLSSITHANNKRAVTTAFKCLNDGKCKLNASFNFSKNQKN